MMADNDNILEPIEGQITLDGGEVKPEPKRYDISEQLADALNESKQRGYKYESRLTPDQFSAVHNRIGELYKSFQTELDDKMADSWQAFRALLRTIERTSCTGELMDLATKINRYKPLFNGKTVDDILEDMELSGEAATTATEENRAIIAEAISWLADLEETGLTVRQIKDAALFLDANRDLITNGTVQQNVLNARDYLDGKKRRYRTKAKTTDTFYIPRENEVFIITDKEYRHALDFGSNPKSAHLIAASLADVELRGNRLLSRADQTELSDDEIVAMTEKEAPNVIRRANMPLLNYVFDLFYVKNMEPTAPKNEQGLARLKLSQFVGYYSNAKDGVNPGASNQESILEQLSHFTGVYGQTFTKTGFRIIDAALTIISYNEETDELTIAAPYINRVAQNVIMKNTRPTQTGEPQLTKSGRPKVEERVSTLAKPALMSNSKRISPAARDITCYCLASIEQAGALNGFHVSAETLISESSYFKYDPAYRLDVDANGKKRTTAEQNKILKRVFSCFLRYINNPKMTGLAEQFPGLITPPEDGPIPKMDTLKSTVYDFPLTIAQEERAREKRQQDAEKRSRKNGKKSKK